MISLLVYGFEGFVAAEMQRREMLRVQAFCDAHWQDLQGALKAGCADAQRPAASNCVNCGAPHEPVCSYCGSRA